MEAREGKARTPSFRSGAASRLRRDSNRFPRGATFDRPLYNYATVLKYQVLETHRGRVKRQTIYVGHYNPAKPRSEVADRHVSEIGGNLKSFREGQVHRMALKASMLDEFTGGILNKYSEEDTDPICWAVWTDLDVG